MNNIYQVEGDLTSEKSRDNYPMMTLCDDCVGFYTVIFKERASSEPCEDCGAEEEEEEEEEEEDFVPDYGYENADDNFDAAYDDIVKLSENY